MRRTTTIDILAPSRRDGVVSLEGSGRDLLTDGAGAASEVGVATMRAEVAFAGDRPLVAIDIAPAPADIDSLLGAPTAAGFRRALEGIVRPEVVGSLAFLLLDDIPVAALLAATPLHRGGDQPFVVGPPPMGVCAGLVLGGEIDRRARDGVPLAVIGPVAPPTARVDDPLSWHPVASLPPGAVRRRRRLDLVATPEGGPCDLDVMVRDTLAESDGRETVIHEFRIRGRVDSLEGVLMSVAAEPHVVPGRECPMAAAYVGRLAGSPLREVRAAVGRSLRGTKSCTHLNDALRSMGDLATLLPLLAS